MRLIHSLAAAALLLTGSVPAMARPLSGEAALAKEIEGRVPGKPVRCIPLLSIRSSRIIDRTAIVYDAGRTIYVNRPVGGASSLNNSDILVSRPTSSSLCNLDIIRLADQSSRMPKGSVSLGDFVPYKKAESARRH
jgi:hypothetical protein